jgi:putative membrane protein
MRNVLTRNLVGALAFALACGAYAADKKGDTRKLSANDRTFISEASQDGLAEVELGKVAQQNAASAEVKQFAQRMVDDHSKANQELETIATQLGATVPKEPGGKHAKMVKELSKKNGARFDHEYAEDMVKDHEKAVALFEKESKKGDSDELKQFAAKTLPVLQEHLKMARALTARKK